MTIKDILDTPLSEMWSVISPFAIGYLLVYGLFFIGICSFIVFVFIQVMKGHREMDKQWRKKK